MFFKDFIDQGSALKVCCNFLEDVSHHLGIAQNHGLRHKKRDTNHTAVKPPKNMILQSTTPSLFQPLAQNNYMMTFFAYILCCLVISSKVGPIYTIAIYRESSHSLSFKKTSPFHPSPGKKCCCCPKFVKIMNTYG